MSAVDPRTLHWKWPRTVDGRRYPPHLRVYEQFDAQLLPLLAQLGEATFDDLSIRVTDRRARAALPRWLTSAEWRGLVERRDPSRAAPRTYVLGPRAHAKAHVRPPRAA